MIFILLIPIFEIQELILLHHSQARRKRQMSQTLLDQKKIFTWLIGASDGLVIGDLEGSLVGLKAMHRSRENKMRHDNLSNNKKITT